MMERVLRKMVVLQYMNFDTSPEVDQGYFHIEVWFEKTQDMKKVNEKIHKLFTVSDFGVDIPVDLDITFDQNPFPLRKSPSVAIKELSSLVSQ